MANQLANSKCLRADRWRFATQRHGTTLRRLVVLLLLTANAAVAEEGQVLADSREAMEPIQWMIGNWRGVGQPRRGSRRGAWTERAEWAWQFDKKEMPRFRLVTKDGKYVQTGQLRASGEPGKFELLVQPPGEETVQFSGAVNEDGHLVFTKPANSAGGLARISLRKAAGGDRLLVLFEKQAGSRYQRLAEVGYTREGSGFGRGTSFVECVVTGGLGTIQVEHNGKTYYVCCTGCRDYFNEDPAGVLADYRERKAAE